MHAPFLDGHDIYTIVKQQGGMGVPEVVRRNPRNIRTLIVPVERPAQVRGEDDCTDRGAEQQIVILLQTARLEAFLCLPGSLPSEDTDRCIVQDHLAPA